MNKNLSRTIRIAGIGIALGVASASLVGSATPASAAPRYERGYERGYERSERTFTGVVLHDVHGDTFDIRTERGRTVTIETNRNHNRLEAGDTVSVRGFWEGQPGRSHFHTTSFDVISRAYHGRRR
ncbi:MAG: hypothetical protein JO316_15020 [Abitibacteriaceae bacterium]|nr:hypothetical protein [Abditibacteriaceae bacterium]